MMNNQQPSAEQQPAPLSKARIFIFCLSLLVMILITAWPHFLGSTTASMKHNAAMVLMMGMSCGFVYGIGYTPKLTIWRWLFSAWSSFTNDFRIHHGHRALKKAS